MVKKYKEFQNVIPKGKSERVIQRTSRGGQKHSESKMIYLG